MNFLRPSSAATWIVCHGQPAMCEHFPNGTDEADDDVREDGIACHWLAAQVYAGNYPQPNSISPNGRVLTDEMFDAVDVYLDVLRAWRGKAHVEMPIKANAIYPNMAGTPDAFYLDHKTNTLHIADLKYGFRFVEVWFNWQLICYIAMVIEWFGLNDLMLTIVATIVQPRSYHREGPVRTWRIAAHSLRPYINDLTHAAAKAMQPEPSCTPNPGCTDCAARHACVALQNSALTAVETSYAGVPLELSPQAVGDELRRLKDAAKKLDARITGLQTQAEALLRAGMVIPHWTLAPTYACERWRDGMESQVVRLGQHYNVELAKPIRPISPTQARKLLPADIVATYSHKPSTGMKLTKQDPYEVKKKFQSTTTE